jgi:hypothetical protein
VDCRSCNTDDDVCSTVTGTTASERRCQSPLLSQAVNQHTNAIIPSFADEILYRFMIYEETGGTRIGVGIGLTHLKVSARASLAPRERDSCGPECGVFDRFSSWQIENKATETGCITEATSHSVGGAYIRLLLTRLMSV